MFVLDRSASMEGTAIQEAKAALIRSLDSLGNLHQFNILSYSGQDHWQLWQPPNEERVLVSATEANKQSANRFISDITTDGDTQHFEPLIESVAHLPDVIFFLTAGKATDDLTPEQLREIERVNKRYDRGAHINVIQFGSGALTDSPPSQSLQQLAKQNRGQYQYVNVPTLLSAPDVFFELTTRWNENGNLEVLQVFINNNDYDGLYMYDCLLSISQRPEMFRLSMLSDVTQRGVGRAEHVYVIQQGQELIDSGVTEMTFYVLPKNDREWSKAIPHTIPLIIDASNPIRIPTK